VCGSTGIVFARQALWGVSRAYAYPAGRPTTLSLLESRLESRAGFPVHHRPGPSSCRDVRRECGTDECLANPSARRDFCCHSKPCYKQRSARERGTLLPLSSRQLQEAIDHARRAGIALCSCGSAIGQRSQAEAEARESHVPVVNT